MRRHANGIMSEIYMITEEDIREFEEEYRKTVPRDRRTLRELRPLIINTILKERREKV